MCWRRPAGEKKGKMNIQTQINNPTLHFKGRGRRAAMAAFDGRTGASVVLKVEFRIHY